MIKATWLFVFVTVLAFSQLGRSISLRENDCTNLAPYCTCSSDGSKVNCTEFNSFKQLNFNGLNVSSIFLTPKQKIALNNDLDIKDVTFWGEASISISNIGSIDVEATPFANKAKKFLKLNIYDSNFQFTYKGQALENPQVCDSVLRNTSFDSMFNDLDEIFFNINVVFPYALCPAIFRNAKLNRIDPRVGNYMVYLPVPEGVKLNSKITMFYLYGSQIKLNSNILDTNVFEETTMIEVLSSRVSTIADDSFSGLTKLKELNFIVEFFDQFIQSSKNTWMINLNKEINIDLKNISGITPEFVNQNALTLGMDNRFNNYKFPEEDFCYYRHFPHQHLVLPQIKTQFSALDCSCTLVYMYQYAYQLQPSSLPSALSKCRDNFATLVQQCNFATKLKECENQPTRTTTVPTTATTSDARSHLGVSLLGVFTIFIFTIQYFRN